MQPQGLPVEVARRNRLVVSRLSALPKAELNQTLGLLWTEIKIAESTGVEITQARDDLEWITTGFKLAQFLHS